MDQMYGQRGPAADVLRFIHRCGPQSIKSLEAELGVTATAVREQVQHLLAEGLLAATKVRRGAGRPAHLYSLTDKAHQLFPQAYDTVLKLLIEQIVTEAGPLRAQQMLNAVGERLADDVTGGLQSDNLRDQITQVSAALAQRGMPITLSEQGDEMALQAWSCPYYSLAREYSGVCAMEQHMLERALDAEVTLVERMIDGHAGCRFMVDRKE